MSKIILKSVPAILKIQQDIVILQWYQLENEDELLNQLTQILEDELLNQLTQILEEDDE